MNQLLIEFKWFSFYIEKQKLIRKNIQSKKDQPNSIKTAKPVKKTR